MATALVFDRDQVDEVEDWTRSVGHIERSAILWIDIDADDESGIDDLARRLDVVEETIARLKTDGGGSRLSDHGTYVHATVFAPAHDDRPTSLERIDCLVSERWIVTVHEQPLDVLDTFRGRAGGSGDTGLLDGPEFLADLLE